MNEIERAREFALHGNSACPMGPATNVDTINNADGSVTHILKEPAMQTASIPLPSAQFVPDHSTGTSFKRYETGALRDVSCDHVRYDLVPTEGLKRLAMTMNEGAAKYGEFTWMLGMPIGETLNHAIKHIFDYLAGDRTEDHLAHASANLFFVMHYEGERKATDASEAVES